MIEKPLLVVAATRDELAPTLARLAGRRRLACPAARLWGGELAGVGALVAATGDGAAAARRGLASVLQLARVERVIGVGVAGGLSPGLEPGELVEGSRVHDLARDEIFEASSDAGGTVVTSPAIVGRRSQKEALWRRLARPRPAVVDLESAEWVRQARRHGIGWRILRAVSDPAEESLALDFEAFRGADGRVRRGRILAHALARPARLGDLRRLRRRVALCAARLAEAAAEEAAR